MQEKWKVIGREPVTLLKSESQKTEMLERYAKFFRVRVYHLRYGGTEKDGHVTYRLIEISSKSTRFRHTKQIN